MNAYLRELTSGERELCKICGRMKYDCKIKWDHHEFEGSGRIVGGG